MIKISVNFFVQGAVIIAITILATWFMFRTNAKLNVATFDMKKSKTVIDEVSNYELNKMFENIKKEYPNLKISFVDYGADGIYNCTLTSNAIIDSVITSSIVSKLSSNPLITDALNKQASFLNNAQTLLTTYNNNLVALKTQSYNDIQAKVLIEELRYKMELQQLEINKNKLKIFGFKFISKIEYKLVKVSILKNIVLSIILGVLLAALNYILQIKLKKQYA